MSGFDIEKDAAITDKTIVNSLSESAETETSDAESKGTETDAESAESGTSETEKAAGTVEEDKESESAETETSDKAPVEKKEIADSKPAAKNKKKKKRFIILLAAAGIIAALLIAYFNFSGWVQLPWMDERCFLEHGIPANQSWVQDGDDYYYTDEKGRMVTDLQAIDGDYYYFDPETGTMQTGWITLEENKTMYFQPGIGKAMKGWAVIDGKMYRFTDEGVMLRGWINVNNNMYFMDDNGVMQTGWLTIDGETYYLAENGIMQTGWVTIGDDTYLMDEEGHKCTGKQIVDGKEYFFDNDGVMRTGWSVSNGKRYYYGSDGTMQTGLITVNGEDFYLGEDGAVDPGWHKRDDESSFYVCTDGFVLDPQDGTGDYGRLIVRSVGIDVFLYAGNSRDDYQPIVDAENSAVVVQERRDLQPVIADRRSQGFNLSGITTGSSAYVVYADGSVQEFECVRTTTASNQGSDVVDGINISVWKQNSGGLGAYASAGTKNPEEVIAVFWEPVQTKDESSSGDTENAENAGDGGQDESSEDGEGGEDEEGAEAQE